MDVVTGSEDLSRIPVAARVAVVIVNWRTADLVSDCLRSLVAERSRLESLRVIVVDNDSGDGSAEKLESLIDQSGWGDWAQLLRAPGNGGFASGNNIGIRKVIVENPDTDYVLLLNPDTYIRDNAIASLARFLNESSQVGVAGGRSEDPDGTPQHCCFRFPGIISEFAGQVSLGVIDRLFANTIVRVGIPEEPEQVGWVSGGVMMVRVELFRQLGLLDEAYFLYFEETDFTLRAHRAGWECWHVPQSRVVHLVGQSSGVTRREGAPRRTPAYWFQSRRRYFVSNYGLVYALALDFSTILGASIARLRSWVQPGRQRLAPGFVGDLVRNSAWIHGSRGLGPRQTS